MRLATGVVFGYFPARRAARPDPIEALRHDWLRVIFEAKRAGARIAKLASVGHAVWAA